MLTISAPIEIKAKTSYLRDPEMFYYRIIGNYSLMETAIGEEDLLHITATPPEIYVQEGEGMTSILAHNERNETNINKVDILNNVLNRIVVSADMDLTYQDRVFITDALYKLGIKDEKRFMKAFYQMAEETRNTNTLINLYLERGDELKELIQSIENREKERIITEREVSENERENFLYSSVMERLQTGAIYQIVSNFNRTQSESEIDAREYSVSNQSYTAQHLLLSVLRERAGVGGENLIFLGGNTYEETIENQENLTSSVRNELTAAVLMDMVKNIYHTGFDRFYNNNNTFYSFEDTFFKSSDQTFLRLIQGPPQMFFTEENNADSFYTQNNALTSSEIELLERKPEGEMSEEEIDRLNETVNAINIQNEQRRREFVRTLEKISKRAEKPRQDDRMARTRKDAALALTNPQKLMQELAERGEQTVRRESEILTQLKGIIPEESMKIYQLLEQYYQGDTQVINNVLRRADVGELIYDSEAADLVDRLEEDSVKKAQRRNDIFTELKEVLPEQSAEVHQMLQQYFDGDTSIINNNLVRRSDITELVHDIRQAQEPDKAQEPGTAKRSREAEEFLQKVREARSEEALGTSQKAAARGPVETIHRQNETLTAEELNEQLNTMETNLQKQIKKDIDTQVITENHVTHQTEVRTSDTKVSHLTARDVEQLVENGVKSQMNTISNQVLTKIEKQMRNEKMRRGY
jgi:hypothetical protein